MKRNSTHRIDRIDFPSRLNEILRRVVTGKEVIKYPLTPTLPSPVKGEEIYFSFPHVYPRPLRKRIG